MINRLKQKEFLLSSTLSIFSLFLFISSLLNYFLYEEFIKSMIYFQFFILSTFLLFRLKDKKMLNKAVEITIIMIVLFIGFLYIDELKNIVLPMILF